MLDRHLHPAVLLFFVLLTLVISGCDSDIKGADENPPTTITDNNNNGTIDPPPTGASEPEYALSLGQSTVSLVEGSTVQIPISIERFNGHNFNINLAAAGESAGDETDMYWQFDDSRISDTENGAVLTLGMNIGPHPIQPQSRTFRLIGSDGQSQLANLSFTIDIAPTSRPDIYLLIGQSNMVGFSEPNSKQADIGEPDAANDRVLQLNVTGNDGENFKTEAAFTNDANIAVPDPRFTRAVDPLHDGFDSLISGKAGTHIGLGLSFGKRAINDTTALVYLVPAAWADTGFCQRPRQLFPGLLGWNDSQRSDSAFSGTLLHDRAIARTNLALAETGGILRGILWHQGEADSENEVCANAYESNLRDMVASLRTNINQDNRGAVARGPDSDVPFVLATMSKGVDERGEFDVFIGGKITVDSVHRNVANIIPNSGFVDNDDLKPSAYECGEGSCIHFGARAYREMGVRYYDVLRQIATQ